MLLLNAHVYTASHISVEPPLCRTVSDLNRGVAGVTAQVPAHACGKGGRLCEPERGDGRRGWQVRHVPTAVDHLAPAIELCAWAIRCCGHNVPDNLSQPVVSEHM